MISLPLLICLEGYNLTFLRMIALVGLGKKPSFQ